MHIYEDGERRMFHNRGTAGQLLPLLPLHRSSRGKGSFRNFSLQQMREIIQRRAEREREREEGRELFRYPKVCIPGRLHLSRELHQMQRGKNMNK